MKNHDTHTVTDMWWTVVPWIFQTIVWVPTRIILWFFFHARIHGRRHVRGLHGSVIFAVNHTSFWDPIMTAGALPFLSRRYPMMYVAREHSYYVKYGRFFPSFLFRAWGAHPAQGGLRDYAVSLATHERLLKKGRSLCMFPEGKVSRATEDIQPFKGGIGYLIHSTHATVVPVVIYGMSGFRAREFFRMSRTIHIYFGDPILYTQSTYPINPSEHLGDIELYKTYAETVRTRMEDIVRSVENVPSKSAQ